jgi:hypothetical protein
MNQIIEMLQGKIANLQEQNYHLLTRQRSSNECQAAGKGGGPINPFTQTAPNCSPPEARVVTMKVAWVRLP